MTDAKLGYAEAERFPVRGCFCKLPLFRPGVKSGLTTRVKSASEVSVYRSLEEMEVPEEAGLVVWPFSLRPALLHPWEANFSSLVESSTVENSINRLESGGIMG